MPVAGDTGANLDSALIHLHAGRPAIFPSLDRYDYRLTNAWSEPIAVSLGHRGSEARDAQIRDPRNVERVVRELEGCKLVILSGRKAKVLALVLRDGGRTVVEVPHVGNKGLNGSYTVAAYAGVASSRARRERRIQLWADAVLQAITLVPKINSTNTRSAYSSSVGRTNLH